MIGVLLGRYRTFFGLPDVARLVAMVMLARMPLGTQGLALLLHVRSLTGSYATAGSTVGTYLAASAITAPILGRIVDRIGPRLPLLVTGAVCPIALLVLLAARPLHLSTPMLLVAAAVAGAFAPPITVLTRTMWRYRFEHDDAFGAPRSRSTRPGRARVHPGARAGGTCSGARRCHGCIRVAVGFATIAVPCPVASPALSTGV